MTPWRLADGFLIRTECRISSAASVAERCSAIDGAERRTAADQIQGPRWQPYEAATPELALPIGEASPLRPSQSGTYPSLPFAWVKAHSLCILSQLARQNAGQAVVPRRACPR